MSSSTIQTFVDYIVQFIELIRSFFAKLFGSDDDSSDSSDESEAE